MNRSSGVIPAITHRLGRLSVLNATDAELLRRFGERRDGDAFEALVVRHGPMVFDVCCGILGGQADTEDAFQATFLVLARRATDIRDPDGLARWLFGVATRTARKARTVARRQRRRDAATPPPQPSEPIDPSWSEVQLIVREELSRIAEQYRLPLALCYLQGRTQDEVATLLGLSKGTLRRRLERGRSLLRERLVRRGLGPAAVLVAAALPTSTVFGAVPLSLVGTTTVAAIKFATGDSSAVSATVSSLTHGVLSTMHLTKLTSAVGTAVPVIVILTTVLGLAADRAPPNTDPAVKTAPVAAAPVPPNPVPKELQPFQGTWTINLCDTANETLHATNRDLRTKWRWTVKGDEIVWAFKGEEWKLQLHVDPTQKPMHLDLTYLSGPYKGEKCLGMYEWGGVDGKSLMISIQDPGAKIARPNAFRMTGTSQNTLIILRRIEPVDPKRELARFEGTWTFALSQTDAWPNPIGKGPDKTGQGSERKWAIKGNEIAWTSPDGQEIKASFTIGPSKVPPHIDLTFLSGPHKGATCIGVYEWRESGNFWLCMVDPGSKAPRPKDISYSTNEGRSMIALDRYLTPAETEVRLLQGDWKFAVCQSEWWPVNRPTTKDEFPKWRWTVKGSEMNWTGVSTGDVKVSFAVDPTKAPKEIDFTFLDGPHKGEKCPGIYKLRGGSLWVCLRDPGTKGDRPTDFPAGTAKGQSLLVLDPVAAKK